ncbi:MAG: cytochrome c oxidase subunit II [Proteobacteria bacterium]|nr:cytochrome c oxidase subunit II [Pseudomonadota bacterium]
MRDSMDNFMKLFLWIVATTTLLGWAGSTYAEYGINFPEPVTGNARDIYNIHMNTVAIITVMMVIVYSIVAFSIYFHRKSRGYNADQNFHKSWFGRWAWVLVPIIVLGVDLSIAGNAERVLKQLWLIPKDENMMEVKVIGHQWWWEYEYLDHGVTVESRYVPKEESGDLYLREVDNNLVLPTNTKIRFLHTSADVMHAFWVPELGMKKDAIAGYITETWAEIDKEGIYRGQCAELCGTWHARMPIVVEAVDTGKFDEWVEQQKQVMLAKAEEAASDKEWSMDELMVKGRGIYNKHCAACHQLGGEGLPPAFPPIKGSKIATGPLADHMNIVLNGKAATGMPAWGELLNYLELAAVITYQRNAWENNTGDLVQPSDVEAAR